MPEGPRPRKTGEIMALHNSIRSSADDGSYPFPSCGRRNRKCLLWAHEFQFLVSGRRHCLGNCRTFSLAKESMSLGCDVKACKHSPLPVLFLCDSCAQTKYGHLAPCSCQQAMPFLPLWTHTLELKKSFLLEVAFGHGILSQQPKVSETPLFYFDAPEMFYHSPKGFFKPVRVPQTSS